MTREREYEGPTFTADDTAGNEYTLIPVYKCRKDVTEDGYTSDDLIRLWSSTGEAVRRDDFGKYTILNMQPHREVALTSRHPKAV